MATIYELFTARHRNPDFMTLDTVEFDLSAGQHFNEDERIKLQNVLTWFAAGYEDALALYLDMGGYCFGAHILGDMLGMNVNYAKYAHGCLQMLKQLDPVTNKDSYDILMNMMKDAIDKAHKLNQPEYEYYEAEYLLLCGKREEAKATFLSVYKGEKPFGGEALTRLDELYREEHPEEFTYREMTSIEKLGESRSFTAFTYISSILLLPFFFPASIILFCFHRFTRSAKDKFYDKRYAVWTKSHYREDNINTEISTFTPVSNPNSNELFKEFISDARPKPANPSSYIKDVSHEYSDQDSTGKWRTYSYTTTETDQRAMQNAEATYYKNLLKWHDNVKENVRLHRIDNWKRLKAKTDQGDKTAQMLMTLMGFNQEHHNNGEAQIPRGIFHPMQPFCYNAVMCWAPYKREDK